MWLLGTCYCITDEGYRVKPRASIVLLADKLVPGRVYEALSIGRLRSHLHYTAKICATCTSATR